MNKPEKAIGAGLEVMKESADEVMIGTTKYPTFLLRILLSAAFVLVAMMVLDITLRVEAFQQLYHIQSSWTAIYRTAALAFWSLPAPLFILLVGLWIFLRRLHRVMKDLYNGKELPQEKILWARKTIRRIPWMIGVLYVLAMVIMGFFRFFTDEGIRWGFAVTILKDLFLGGVAAVIEIQLYHSIMEKPRWLLQIYDFQKRSSRKGFIERIGQVLILSAYLLLALFDIVGVIDRRDSTILELAIEHGSDREQINRAFQERIAEEWEIPVDDVDMVLLVEEEDTLWWVFIRVLPHLLLLAAVFQFLVSRSKLKQVRSVIEKLEAINRGKANITTKIPITLYDETGELTMEWNRFADKLKGILDSIAETVEELGSSSRSLEEAMAVTTEATENLVESNRQVEENTEAQSQTVKTTSENLTNMIQSLDRISEQVNSQASFVEESSSAITEMVASIKNVTVTTTEANELATKLTDVAKDGQKAVNQSVEAVRDVENSSDEVNDIVGVISKIAAQTNMLAMNAAVEAAHAGDAGRGFAVVAEEVRNLAENSARSAGQITTHIAAMIDLISNGVELSEEAGQALRRVAGDVHHTTTLIDEIASAMAEQAVGAEEILQGITSLVESIEEVKAISLSQKEKNRAVRQAIEELIRVFNEIQDASRAQGEGNRNILREIRNVSKVMEVNQMHMKKLGEILDQFD